MLDVLNERVDRMQKEAQAGAEEGSNSVGASEWIAHVITKTTDVAASSLVSTRTRSEKYAQL